jgi:hypothetical protein
MAVLTVIAVAAVIRHAVCSGVSAGFLFSIPPSERARRLAEVVSLDDGVIVLAAMIFMHMVTDSQRRPFVGRTAVSLWVREALLCHIVTKHLNVASQHVTECNDFVLPPPRTGAPDSLAVCLKRVVLERKKVSKVLLILSCPRKSILFNHKSHAGPLMHTPALARTCGGRQAERLQQTRGQTCSCISSGNALAEKARQHSISASAPVRAYGHRGHISHLEHILGSTATKTLVGVLAFSDAVAPLELIIDR